MRLKTAILVVLLVLLTWAGAGGISFAVVELTGGGPQGEQGLQGPPGPPGPRGLAGTTPSLDAIDLQELRGALERLAALWASNQTGESTSHPVTIACAVYILTGGGSAADCRFFPIEE